MATMSTLTIGGRPAQLHDRALPSENGMSLPSFEGVQNSWPFGRGPHVPCDRKGCTNLQTQLAEPGSRGYSFAEAGAHEQERSTSARDRANA